MRTSRPTQRGAATVEAALSMLVIIPCLMYSLFLDDLLRYAGDLQEAVLSTPWDFTGQDYNRPDTLGLGPGSFAEPVGGGTRVQGQARLMFCDHESSGDSYGQGQDCVAQDHHQGKALSGHVCWVNPGAHQVTCERPRTEPGSFRDPLFARYKQRFQGSGGLYECHGQEVVENYLLPKGFLQEFAGTVELARKNWSGDGSNIHQNAADGNKTTAYYLAEQRFALLTDSWALNELTRAEDEKGLELSPGTQRGPLYDRVEQVYQGNVLFGVYAARTTGFVAEASRKLLVPGFSLLLDDPLTPQVAFPRRGAGPPAQEIQQDKKTYTYFSSPWRDWSTDAYKETHAQRGAFYLGCRTAGGC